MIKKWDWDEAFFSKVEVTSTCWNWTASKIIKDGYGRFTFKYKHYMAHRFIYEKILGPIPRDMVVDHICKNRACVNLNHLRIVTVRDNVLKNSNSLQAKNAVKTHCKYGHEFTKENTYGQKKGKNRSCRICMRRLKKEYRSKHGA